MHRIYDIHYKIKLSFIIHFLLIDKICWNLKVLYTLQLLKEGIFLNTKN